MIGGIVIETIELADKVWINCKEKCSTSTCAIYVTKSPRSRSVSEGDTVWWQGGRAFWTPSSCPKRGPARGGEDYDIVLDRIGFSGVSRPKV